MIPGQRQDGKRTWHEGIETIIRPEDLVKQSGAHTAIMTFTESLFEPILSTMGMNNAPAAPDLDGALEGRLRDGIGIYRSQVGAPAAGMLLEELIASGIKRTMMLGYAGSLSKRCRIGDLVIPTWGIREEGTSYHYLSGEQSVAPSKELLRMMRDSLDGTIFHEGGVWTTDAPFREFKDKIDEYEKAGALAVEMECTALMAISMFRQTEFAALLVISDETYRHEWVEGFDTDRLKRSVELACGALKKAASRQELKH